MNNFSHPPLDVISACRLRDLHVLKLTAKYLPQYVPLKQLHVVTARVNFSQFEDALGSGVTLIDEDALIPGMTLDQLRALKEPGFPQGAGWYFQQFLKYAFAFQSMEDDHYLIWDADTVPLRPLTFFDNEGRLLFTKADEYHRPYFETYKRLLQQDASREFSFISQHMVVRKSFLREMLQTIENNFPGPENWAWKIMANLAGSGTNRFSEYETFGHYLKNRHPEAVAYRQLSWLRDGSQIVSASPTDAELTRLAEQYHFAAFEVRLGRMRRAIRQFKKWLPRA